MPLSLIVLIVLAVGAFAVAAYSLLVWRYRSAVIGRAAGEVAGAVDGARISIDLRDLRRGGLGARLQSLVPASWGEDEAARLKLVRAGYDSPTAPLTYVTVRVIFLVAMLVAVAPFVMGSTPMVTALLVGWSLVAGWAIPVWFVNRQVYLRKERIRRSVPDALDLLVVCIEAGVSLDAAILRVSRELSTVHRELSGELLVVNRKSNAGVPREQALRGLWERTGVDEVRALVSTMIQSEKWGTSIGTVLQVYAETLRRKRRQAVEKKAATIPVKMLFPLILFILPALFAVVMGPAVIQIPKLFQMGQ
ncbi:MAG TPA: type II secretion system F family protein [Gemmatimonadaceae bacterium]|nr:type II secretion system F family protein [Gemmatimonadaceae bacterium]